MSAKNWTITYNDAILATTTYVDNLIQRIPELLLSGGVGYLVLQSERGQSGTDHIQGYVQFSARRTLKQVKETLEPFFPGCHLEKAKGSPEQNRTYCTKQETRTAGPWEFGSISKPGKRNDIQEFVDAMPMTDDEIFDRFPHILAKYPNFIRTAKRRQRQLESVEFKPRDEWQFDLLAFCHSPSHPRQVRWYHDATGGLGKSYFCRTFGHRISYIITGGKHADIFYAYNHEPFVFFDWPRSAEDTFPYGVVEAFKNGYFLSTKYESVPVKFQPPIVIIFANFEPDLAKLSQDRWEIINL